MTKRGPLTFKLDNPVVATKPEAGLHNEVQTTKHANTQTRKGRVGRQFVAAHVLPEAAKQLKILAAQEARTTQALIIEAINDLFAKYGLSRIADD